MNVHRMLAVTAREPEIHDAGGVMDHGSGPCTVRGSGNAALALWCMVVLLGTAVTARAHTVTADYLNVRSGPGFGYSVIGTLRYGTVVTVVGTSGSWSKISSPRAGWVYSSYLSNTAHSGGSTTTTTSSGLTNLNMAHYYQVNNYFCGPTTAQMVIRHVSGRYLSQYTVNGVVRANSWSGSSAYQVASGIRYFSGQSYNVVSGFSPSRVITNIRNNKPVPINFKTRYLAYTGYRDFMHHSPIKGYTSGGFYIHDSAWGPNKWASTTQVSNAVRYHYNLYIVRY